MRRDALIALAFAGSLAVSPPAAAETVDGSSYACRPLPEALRELRDRGLPVVFGSNLVRDGMQVTAVPDAASPRHLLDQLLAPHGLRVQEGAGGRLLVVQDFSAPGAAPPWSMSRPPAPSTSGRFDGVLPAWVEMGRSRELAVLDVPRQEVALDPGTRYLVLRLADAGAGAFDWPRLAFRLKALIVEARSRAQSLEVGLEASPAAVARLLEHDLAQYLDAYVYTAVPRRPAGDATARLWWRVSGGIARTALHTLLAGAAQGAALVLLDAGLDARQRAFLERVQATASVDLERQPAIEGMAADRVRFLYNLKTGSYYLAAYAEPGRRQRLVFSLGRSVEARSIYPGDGAVAALRLGDRTELELSGDHPFHLVELRPETARAENGVLRVDGQALVDPYEVVVRNQVFQEREARKVRSLDVMERRHSILHDRSARRYTWTHRVIERPGRLTEFHHLGLERNGVKFPERKLRVGRDFRAEAQVELEPLEIELDRTYRYEYLGEEPVDGHRSWKIGFEPLHDGAYLAGTVWIDQETHAHRKLRFVHTGLSGPLIRREVTRTYGWIADDDQCFWNWSRSEGLAMIESPTSRVAVTIDAERFDFDYNRDDIERQVRLAHASDVPIHVAVPPDGHRWLVAPAPKSAVGIASGGQRRRLLGRLFHRRGRGGETAVALAEDRGGMTSGARHPYPVLPSGGPTQHGAPVPDFGTFPAGDGTSGGRVLADRDAYATTWDAFLIARENCSNTISCSGIGVDYRRTDLFKNRAEIYAGVYDIQSHASFTYPRLGGSRWVMTAGLKHDLTYWTNGILHPGTTDVWAGFEERRSSLSLAFARPIGSALRAHAVLGFHRINLRRGPWGETPGFRLPESVLERVSAFELHFQRRKLYSRALLQWRVRAAPEPWGIDGSEPLARSPARFILTAGYSTALPRDRSYGSRVVVQRGWNLDHFSDFFSGFGGARAPGFQPQRFDLGLGAGVSWNGRISRHLPLTLRLEGALLRSERYPWKDADQLGLEVETFLPAWLKTDVFLRLGYGLYSSVPDQDGDLRTRIILSRKF